MCVESSEHLESTASSVQGTVHCTGQVTRRLCTLPIYGWYRIELSEGGVGLIFSTAWRKVASGGWCWLLLQKHRGNITYPKVITLSSVLLE